MTKKGFASASVSYGLVLYGENATKEAVLEEDESKNEENGGGRKSGCVRLLSRQRHGQLTAWSGQGK